MSTLWPVSVRAASVSVDVSDCQPPPSSAAVGVPQSQRQSRGISDKQLRPQPRLTPAPCGGPAPSPPRHGAARRESCSGTCQHDCPESPPVHTTRRGGQNTPHTARRRLHSTTLHNFTPLHSTSFHSPPLSFTSLHNSTPVSSTRLHSTPQSHQMRDDA